MPLAPPLRLASASLLALLALAGCRQAVGLDEFKFLQCTPGEAGCVLPPEDCVAGADTNGDGIPPAACTGEVAWLRTTPSTEDRSCLTANGTTQVPASHHLLALASFGSWAGALATASGTLAECDARCLGESFSQDAAGDALGFDAGFRCNQGAGSGALARGKLRGYAATASGTGSEVVMTSHQLGDGAFAARWAFNAPEAVSALALAGGESPVIAVGQSATLLLVEPDQAQPGARFHALATTHISAIARAAGGALLLAGHATNPAKSPGPCGLAAADASIFVLEAELGAGSADPAAPGEATCGAALLELPIGADTGSPVTRVATQGDHVCWAYAGTDGNTNVRRVRAGCLDRARPSEAWQVSGTVGNPADPGLDIAVDAFDNLVLVTSAQAIGWEGASIALAAEDTTNLLLLKLAGRDGGLVWARVFASPGGDAREPRVTADDDGLVRLGAVTEGAPLVGKGLSPGSAAPGPVIHFLGVRP